MLHAKPRTPDLLEVIAPPNPAIGHPLTLEELDDAITALLDREDLASGDDELARLRRVRSALERHAATLLEE